MMRGLAGLAIWLAAGAALAETPLRIATYNVSMARYGPGLLYKELTAETLPAQVEGVLSIIARVDPDILLVNEIDYDGGEKAVDALRELLAARGAAYPYSFAAPSNTGIPSGHDLDGDGESGGPRDAFGFGRFPGQYGMAVLSRHPIDRSATRTFATMLWQDLPGAILPVTSEGEPFPGVEAQGVMRLSSKSHWDVVVETPGGDLHILASHPTPPVFDGPEDLNGRRNHDEIRFWQHYLDGQAFEDDQGRVAPMGGGPFVVLGDLNADPADGDGRRVAITDLLTHPRLVDPRPASTGGRAASEEQGGANRDHRGDPSLDTADWSDTGPGNLRVDFVLPATQLRLEGSGVFWPDSAQKGAELLGAGDDRASDHHLVWVDVLLAMP